MKTHNHPLFISKILLVLLLSASLCAAAPTISYTGKLASDYTGANSTSADGMITANGGWNNVDHPVTLSWRVSLDSVWHYEYVLTVPDGNLGGGGISHMLLETSESFTANNIWNLSWSDTLIGNNYGPGEPGKSNPGIPGDLFGIKFDKVSEAGEVISFSVDFYSDRNPVWGDFYSKDGVQNVKGVKTDNTAWNAGFTSPDTDPSDDPDNGSIGSHLLVPDTQTTRVPAPAALALGALGVGITNWLRRKRILN